MPFNVDLMQLMQMVRQNPNPQQFVMQILEQQASSSPLYANILNLAKNGNTAELEQIARNLCKEKGLDYDKEFNSFRNGLKR